MLRLAQFKLIASIEKHEEIASCVVTLLSEIDRVSDLERRAALEIMVLFVVLNKVGIADHVENWVHLLVRIKSVVEKNEETQAFKQELNQYDLDFDATLFLLGVSRISSVRRLEEIVDDLNSLDATERSAWLRVFEDQPDNCEVLLNAPWMAEQDRNTIDPMDAAQRYRRIGVKLKHWGFREIATRCHVVGATILNQCSHDVEAALAALDEGEAAFGKDIILAHCRAEVLWQHDRRTEALEILRSTMDQVGLKSPIERTFAMREAAVKAATVGEWRLAEIWFADGQAAAATVEQNGSIEIVAISIGLEADAGVAALQIGELDRALDHFSSCLTALQGVDPDASLQAAYCHRVVRHALLWAEAKIDEREISIGGQPIVMLPGTCSNPKPLPAIREHPLAHLDSAWYMLADMEVSCGARLGIQESLPAQLSEGPIPTQEAILQIRRITRIIKSLDAAAYAEHFLGFLGAVKHLSIEANASQTKWDASSPTRGTIIALSLDSPTDPLIEEAAIDAILAFGFVASINENSVELFKLEEEMSNAFGDKIPGGVVFAYWKGCDVELSPLDKSAADAIASLRAEEQVDPRELWEIELRLFEKINKSTFKTTLTALIAAWMREYWQKVIAKARFRLKHPMITVPVIEAALTQSKNDAAFVASLLLASANAVGATLSDTYRNHLNDILEERL